MFIHIKIECIHAGCVCVRVCVCVHACVRACVRACVCVCAALIFVLLICNCIYFYINFQNKQNA